MDSGRSINKTDDTIFSIQFIKYLKNRFQQLQINVL